jgi:hypothetical protein
MEWLKLSLSIFCFKSSYYSIIFQTGKIKFNLNFFQSMNNVINVIGDADYKKYLLLNLNFFQIGLNFFPNMNNIIGVSNLTKMKGI